MMRRGVLSYLLLLCLLAPLTNCQGPTSKKEQAEDGASLAEPESDETNEIVPPRQVSDDPEGTQPRRVRARQRTRYRGIRLTQNEKESLEISTVKVSYKETRSVHTAMGKVLAPQTRMAKVSYAFPARISAIHVNIGDWVQKGQPVLTLQSEEVGRAKSEYYTAIAGFELARTNYERETSLFDRGVGAEKNTLASEAEFKVAQSTLEAAEKRLHVLGFSEADVESISKTHQINPEITLFAPIGGKVIEHEVVLGDMIDQTAGLLTIMDPTLLWVDAEIFERDIAQIRIAQDVQITLPAYPGEAFRGKLSYVSDILNAETRTITVRTEVKNRGFKLKPGMFADVTIFLSESHEVMTVPTEAILDDKDEKLVFVEANGRYVPRNVEVGDTQDGYCTILSGLEEGDEVVTKGNYLLKSRLYEDLLKAAGVH